MSVCWDDRKEGAFRVLPQVIISKQILMPLSYERPFAIQYDASDRVTLCQRDTVFIASSTSLRHTSHIPDMPNCKNHE